MAEFRHLDVVKNGVVYVVRFSNGRILENTVIERTARELHQLADLEDCRNLLLNFSGVTFLASSMLGKLLTLNKRMKAKDGLLKLCELAPEVRQLFEMTGLAHIFDIRSDETNGLLAFYQ